MALQNSRNRIRPLHDMLLKKDFSCKELTEAYLESIRKDTTNAYVYITETEALASASAVDKKIASGEEISLLEGIPMSLKDNISTKDIPTTCCSHMLSGYTPIYDATIWEKLKNQNAVLLGKTNMDEFAMGSTNETSVFGAVSNPYNTSLVPGGSSGGSAAAVSAGLCAYSLGSDTGGSVRQPASFCGLVGLKPTYGVFSRWGLIAHGSSFDQIGPLASSAEDAAILLRALSGSDHRDSTSKTLPDFSLDDLRKSIKGKRIGILREAFKNVSSDVKTAVLKTADIFASMGAKIEECSIPLLTDCLPVYYILASAEASSNLGRYDGIRYGHHADHGSDWKEQILFSRSEGFGKEVKRRILLGTFVLSAGYYDAFYEKAQLLRYKITEDFHSALKQFDCFLLPSTPTAAFGKGLSDNVVENFQADYCTVAANCSGLPAVSFPCGITKDGLPLSAQLMGRPFEDFSLLQMVSSFEQVSEPIALPEVFSRKKAGGVFLADYRI